VVSAGSAKAVRHRVNGLVVADGSARGYADAIVHLLRAPDIRAALGRAARRTVEHEYGWDRVIDQVERIYAMVLARRGVPDTHAAVFETLRAAGIDR
jgi:glycosyltransferase involved in cell wall biosynthesis